MGGEEIDVLGAKPDDVQLRWWVWQCQTGAGKPWQYICWINDRWAQWKTTGRGIGVLTDQDHRDFDAWLVAQLRLPP